MYMYVNKHSQISKTKINMSRQNLTSWSINVCKQTQSSSVIGNHKIIMSRQILTSQHTCIYYCYIINVQGM
jgi:hypothetical protein